MTSGDTIGSQDLKVRAVSTGEPVMGQTVILAWYLQNLSQTNERWSFLKLPIVFLCPVSCVINARRFHFYYPSTP